MSTSSTLRLAGQRLATQVRGTVRVVDGGPGATGDVAPGVDLVVEPVSSADVASAVRVAAELDLAVRVAGTRHRSVDPSGPAHLSVDLRHLTAVRVEPTTRLVHVQSGTPWSILDRLTQAHGLATTGSHAPTETVASAALRGGNGHLARRHALTTDNLVGADVVTADARIVRTSPTEHPDLFWALRGGGGGFGVVTSLTFLLHPVGPDVATVMALYRWDDAPLVVSRWVACMREATEAVSTRLVAIPAPRGVPTLDDERPVIAVVGMYAGPSSEGESQLPPFTGLARPIRSAVRVESYVRLQQRLAPPAAGWQEGHVDSLERFDDDAADRLVRRIGALPSDGSLLRVDPLGGAVGRVPDASTPFHGRDAAAHMVIAAPPGHVVPPPASSPGPNANHQRRLLAVRSEWDPRGRFRPVGAPHQLSNGTTS